MTGESAAQTAREASDASTSGRIEMTKLTDEQLRVWAATRVRMLLARLIVLAMRGEKLP